MTPPDRPSTSELADSGERLLSFEIQRQPDDETCGPTCLHAIYRYFNDSVPFDQVLTEVQALELGGTLGVILAAHAMSRGYKATIMTWNLAIFDPSWFALPKGEMQKRLRERAAIKNDPKLRFASHMYADFLDKGGVIEMHDLRPALLRKYLKRRLPILTGLSATFLYRDPREIGRTNQPDDIRGEPVGHFTVLTGYSPGRREVYVSDPMYPNPLSKTHTYPVSIERVVGAIYLGVLTYDANLIVLQPPS